jgi:hypothetical protein
MPASWQGRSPYSVCVYVYVYVILIIIYMRYEIRGNSLRPGWGTIYCNIIVEEFTIIIIIILQYSYAKIIIDSINCNIIAILLSKNLLCKI